MNRWQIGAVKISRVVELEVAGGTRFILPDATPEACREIAWLAPHFMTAEGKLIMSIHALVVDTGNRRCCIGRPNHHAADAAVAGAVGKCRGGAAACAERALGDANICCGRQRQSPHRASARSTVGDRSEHIG